MGRLLFSGGIRPSSEPPGRVLLVGGTYWYTKLSDVLDIQAQHVIQHQNAGKKYAISVYLTSCSAVAAVFHLDHGGASRLPLVGRQIHVSFLQAALAANKQPTCFETVKC